MPEQSLKLHSGSSVVMDLSERRVSSTDASDAVSAVRLKINFLIRSVYETQITDIFCLLQ